jgi:RNase P subunit RPR2
MKKKKSWVRVIYPRPKVKRRSGDDSLKCKFCGGALVLRTYVTRATEDNDESRELVYYCKGCDFITKIEGQ